MGYLNAGDNLFPFVTFSHGFELVGFLSFRFKSIYEALWRAILFVDFSNRACCCLLYVAFQTKSSYLEYSKIFLLDMQDFIYDRIKKLRSWEIKISVPV